MHAIPAQGRDDIAVKGSNTLPTLIAFPRLDRGIQGDQPKLVRVALPPAGKQGRDVSVSTPSRRETKDIGEWIVRLNRTMAVFFSGP